MKSNQVEIKLIPQANPNQFDIWLQEELIAKKTTVQTAFQAATSMLKVFEAMNFKISRVESFPMGGRYWLLTKPN